MSEHDEGNPFLSGLMIGGIIGAALGVILSGEENREKLWKKIEEFDFENVIEKFSHAFEEGTKEASEVAKKIKREEEL